MHYEIIKDKEALERFIKFLPDLHPHEAYMVALFARSKYTDEGILSSDKANLIRTVARKETIIRELHRMEGSLGSYTAKQGNVAQEALAVYITVNPRDLFRATHEASKHLADCIYNKNEKFDPVQETLSAVQQSKSYSFAVVFDIDTKEVSFDPLTKIFNGHTSCYRLLETRGGYHLLVFPKEVNRVNSQVSKEDRLPTNWYLQTLTAFKGVVDQYGDLLIPIPGCYQGGFVPVLQNSIK